MISTKKPLKKRIINAKIDLLSYSECKIEILKHASENKNSFICFANTHMTIEAYRNPWYADYINNSLFTVADGVPLKFSIRLIYGIQQERIAGMDFTPDLINEAEKHNLLVYFFGSSPEVLNKIEQRIFRENPNLKIAGLYSPPFRKLTENENEKIINDINDSGANLVFVGLGCPKQEIWMAQNSQKINAVLLGVGAAFNTYAQTLSMAPQWMRDNGIEWIYRFFQEPKRLFKRYLMGNSLFVFLILKQLIKTRFRYRNA